MASAGETGTDGLCLRKVGLRATGRRAGAHRVTGEVGRDERKRVVA